MTVTTAPSSPRAGAHQSIAPRLVVSERPLELAEERGLGTLAAARPGDLVEALAEAGLRGRGGAGFPTARKLDTVRSAAGPRVVVANGGEGTIADLRRWGESLRGRGACALLDGAATLAGSIARELAPARGLAAGQAVAAEG